MALSGSARAKACQLRKQGYTEFQISTYLFEHNYIRATPKETALEKQEKIEQKNVNENVNKTLTNVNTPDATLTDITTDELKAELLDLYNTATDFRVKIKIMDYLVEVWKYKNKVGEQTAPDEEHVNISELKTNIGRSEPTPSPSQ